VDHRTLLSSLEERRTVLKIELKKEGSAAAIDARSAGLTKSWQGQYIRYRGSRTLTK